MTRQSTLRPTLTAAALSLTLAAAMMVASAPARAAEDDTPSDSKIIRGVLESIGLKKDGEAINYQERAPLVIPPSKTLPPPQNADAAIANNPAWPKDPDVQRSKAEKAAALRDRYKSADEKIRDENRVLRPGELTPGKSSGGTAPAFRTTEARARSPKAIKDCRRRSLAIAAGYSAICSAARTTMSANSPASRRERR